MNLTQSAPEEDQFDADLVAWLKANCDQETRNQLKCIADSAVEE